MIFVKVGAYFFSSLLALAFSCMVYWGITIRQARKAGEVDLFNEVAHQLGAKACIWITVIMAVLIEGTQVARYGFHMRPYPPLFSIHFWAEVIPYLALLGATAFWVTGFRYRRWHRFVAYALVSVMIPLVITGDILLYHF